MCGWFCVILYLLLQLQTYIFYIRKHLSNLRKEKKKEIVNSEAAFAISNKLKDVEEVYVEEAAARAVEESIVRVDFIITHKL